MRVLIGNTYKKCRQSCQKHWRSILTILAIYLIKKKDERSDGNKGFDEYVWTLWLGAAVDRITGHYRKYIFTQQRISTAGDDGDDYFVLHIILYGVSSFCLKPV